MTEDKMVGWHHQLNRHEFKQALVLGDGQGSLVCCSSWGRKELDTTEQLNRTELNTCWTPSQHLPPPAPSPGYCPLVELSGKIRTFTLQRLLLY